MKALPITALLLLPLSLFAAGGGHSNEIPGVILWQVVNLGILLGALVYFLKDTVIKAFADKRTAFLAEFEKSKAAQATAEKSYLDVKAKLEELNRTANQSVSKAEKEAEEMKKLMIADAKSAAAKVREESQRAAMHDTSKAQRNLQIKIATEAISAARSILSKDIGSSDHQKLQSDFTKNIQAVHS